jgi:hypothetical protein
MRKRQAGKISVYVLVLVLLVWPVFQVYELFHSKLDHTDATHLLYQVTLFQMELLSSYLQQSGTLQDSGGLDALKQALYSANYSHERLSLAVGSDRLALLSSMNQLMQYVLRLQVGGNRPLKVEEKQVLQDAAAQFKDIYEIYQKLMSSGGSIIFSQHEKLVKKDGVLSDMIRKKLLE